MKLKWSIFFPLQKCTSSAVMLEAEKNHFHTFRFRLSHLFLPWKRPVSASFKKLNGERSKSIGEAISRSERKHRLTNLTIEAGDNENSFLRNANGRCVGKIKSITDTLSLPNWNFMLSLSLLWCRWFEGEAERSAPRRSKKEKKTAETLHRLQTSPSLQKITIFRFNLYARLTYIWLHARAYHAQTLPCIRLTRTYMINAMLHSGAINTKSEWCISTSCFFNLPSSLLNSAVPSEPPTAFTPPGPVACSLQTSTRLLLFAPHPVCLRVVAQWFLLEYVLRVLRPTCMFSSTHVRGSMWTSAQRDEQVSKPSPTGHPQ